MKAPVVHLALRWSDIESMPPSPRRDELAYAWQQRARAAQHKTVAALDALPLLMARADATRAAAVLTYDDPPAVLAERRAVLAAVAALHQSENRTAA